MIYLILSILTAWWLIFCFKMFDKFQIKQLDAIVVNYFICCTMSYIYLPKESLQSTSINSWFPYAMLLGFFFILLFNLMAYCTKKIGITVTSTANKLSLVLPVLAGYFLLNEKEGFTYVKVIGFLFALISIYLITRKDEKEDVLIDKKLFFLPIILFLWNGLNDTLLSVVQKKYLPDSDYAFFTLVVFGISFIMGICYLTYLKITNKESLQFRNIIAGIVLGIPNFYSIYFLLKALKESGFTNSEVYTIVNIGILVVSAVSGYFIFKEKLTRINIVGLLLAIVSLFLISYV